MAKGRVLIYGGKGALGSSVLDYFKKNDFWVLNVDLNKNELADANVTPSPLNCWIEQESHIMKEVGVILKNEKLDAILCVAGGWAGGNAAHKDFIKNADLMWKQSVWSSTISARLAAQFLQPTGLLQLTGASAAIDDTPEMIGYGLAKAAVHQLVKSLAHPKSGLPEESTILALLPVILDTPMNRKWMPKADFSTWTPLDFVAETLLKWTMDKGSRPKSGSLLKLETQNDQTRMSPV